MSMAMNYLDSDVLALARSDRARYLTALSAPVAVRPALLVLLAFDAEISKIPKVVSEPMLGRIRLQWWLDALPAIAAGRPPGHPVAQALAHLGKDMRLDIEALKGLVEARNFELDGDFTAGPEALTYARASGGAVQALVLAQLGVHDANAMSAARDIGAALTLAHLGLDAQAQDVLNAARAIPLEPGVKKAALPALLLARLVDRRLRLGPRAGDGAGAVMSVWWGKLTGHY